ncbi:hypothetical protein ACWDA3_13115 [Nonomuraea rubra]
MAGCPPGLGLVAGHPLVPAPPPERPPLSAPEAGQLLPSAPDGQPLLSAPEACLSSLTGSVDREPRERAALRPLRVPADRLRPSASAPDRPPLAACQPPPSVPPAA